MGAGARRGASAAVVRAIEGHSGAHISRSSESAACPLCKDALRFFSGEFGQTFEQCDNVRCLNHIPHHPQPDPNASEPRTREPKKRPRKVEGEDSRRHNRPGRPRTSIPPEFRAGNA